MAALAALLIRIGHVIGLAVLLGGSTVAWAALRDGAGLSLARQFEWAFWGAVGLVVVTGVGNLGGVGVPAAGTGRRPVLVGKLLLVTAFVVGSAVRTFLVVRATERRERLDSAGERGDGVGRLLARTYGTTGVVVVAVVVLGEVLAHG